MAALVELMALFANADRREIGCQMVCNELISGSLDMLLCQAVGYGVYQGVPGGLDDVFADSDGAEAAGWAGGLD